MSTGTTRHLILFLGNLGRRLAEWSDRKLEIYEGKGLVERIEEWR